MDEVQTERDVSKGPRGRRRGRGARERILHASHRLFREQGINRTGIDQLCKEANVSTRTAYQHFGSKDGIVDEHLRQHDLERLPGVFDRTDLEPRERLLAAFETPQRAAGDVTPLCPFLAAAVEIPEPEHQLRVRVRDYKASMAQRLTDVARDAGAINPGELGEQLALLLDGASARTRALNEDSYDVAAAIAAMLVDRSIPGTPPTS